MPTLKQIDHMQVRSRWASSVIDCRAYNGAQSGSEHGSDHAMVRARLRPRMKAARTSNRPAKLDTAKLKTVALEHLGLDLRNRFEGSTRMPPRRTNGESSKTRSQTLPRHISEKRAIAVGTGSLVKRLHWQSKRAWRGFKVHQITGSEKANNEGTTP